MTVTSPARVRYDWQPAAHRARNHGGAMQIPDEAVPALTAALRTLLEVLDPEPEPARAETAAERKTRLARARKQKQRDKRDLHGADMSRMSRSEPVDNYSVTQPVTQKALAFCRDNGTVSRSEDDTDSVTSVTSVTRDKRDIDAVGNSVTHGYDEEFVQRMRSTAEPCTDEHKAAGRAFIASQRDAWTAEGLDPYTHRQRRYRARGW